jgi:hypothetical protein
MVVVVADGVSIKWNEGVLEKVVEEMNEAISKIANDVAATCEGNTEDELVQEMQIKGRSVFAEGAGPNEQAWRDVARLIITKRDET